MNNIELKSYNKHDIDEESNDTAIQESQTSLAVGRTTDKTRNKWSNEFDFLFSLIGFAVDLSNVFRFPYVCYRNGGGAFLIPYFVMLMLTALPVFYLELTYGQYMRCGGLTIWKLCPLLKGVGYASIILTCYVALYYNVIIAWALYYFFASFSIELPWTRCDQYWNTKNCFIDGNNISQKIKIDSATEYLENRVLKLQNSEGLHDLGAINYELALTLLLQYIMLFFCLFKGVKILGKAVWITAILPYVILTVLLIRGLLLSGSWSGIKYFIKPTFNRLQDLNVWIEAAAQIFFSIGVGFSVHIAYASYNDFHQSVHRSCLIAAFVNSFTSLFSGFVVFSYIGYLSQVLNKKIEDVTNQNPAMIFIVYPQALATIPGAQFWSCIFFLMLFSLGLDSSFGALESFLTAILDEFKDYFKKLPYRREIATGAFLSFLFLMSLPNLTYGGFFLIQIFDKYSAGASLLFVALFEVIGFVWIYGIDEGRQFLIKMNNMNMHIIFRVLIKIITPLLLAIVVITQFISDPSLTVDISNKTYKYPSWSFIIGYMIQFSSIIFIPVFAIIAFIRSKGKTCKEKLALSITPEWEHEEIMKSKDVKRFRLKHWLSI